MLFLVVYFIQILSLTISVRIVKVLERIELIGSLSTERKIQERSPDTYSDCRTSANMSFFPKL